MIKPVILATSFVFAMLWAMFSAHPVIAKTPAGKAVKVSGSASTSGPRGKMRLSTGNAVFAGDTIKTGFSSRVQLLFSDQTRLVVGPRSKIRLDSYVLGRKNSASSFAIKAARGTFRFLSGKSKKSIYKISTSTATIGIRGTSFDFADRGQVSVVLYSGSVQVCTSRSCTTLVNKCDLAQESRGRITKSTTAQLVPNAYNLTFPFIRRESLLLPGFRVGAGACDAQAGQGPSGGNGNGDRGGANQ